MSSPHACGRLWEVVTYESLDYIGTKFGLNNIWQLQRLNPCIKCFIHKKSQFQRENMVLSLFPSLVVSRNAIMLKHLIIQFLLHYLSSGCLWKVKSKRKFQTFNSTKSVHGGFKRCLFTIGNKYSDLETSGILEHWSLKRRKDCITRQTVTLSSQIPHRSGIIMSVKSTA